MKKTVATLAVLAASGAALAQSSVTVYGVADVALAKKKGTDAALISDGASSSRIGFKGVEDLGGGLKATFVLENGFDMTSGAAKTVTLNDQKTKPVAAFSRETTVGLAGSFGAVRIGRMTTAYDDISENADAGLGTNALGIVNVLFDTNGNYVSRPSSGIHYATPSFNGFSGAVSTMLEGADKDSRVSAFHVKYKAGAIYAGLGYQHDKQKNVKNTRLNGSYDFGSFKLLGSYGRETTKKVNEYMIGVEAPVASNVVMSLGFGSSKTDGANKQNAWTLAAAYSLSKRTSIYGGYFGANTAAEVAGKKDTLAVGVKHSF